MTEKLFANFRVLLKFYRRNRLLLVIALIFLLLAGLTLSGSLVFGSTTGRFDIIATVESTLIGFTLVLSGGLGLFAISSHLRQRSLKMVMTKPCPPEIWVGSVFLSAAWVAGILYAFAALVGAALSLLWSVPLQTGLVYLALQGFLRSCVVLSYLSFLTILMHPVLAILISVLFNEGTFESIRYLLLTAIKTTGGNPLLPFLEKATWVLFMLLPSYSPYEGVSSGVEESFRATAADWLALAKTAGYAAAALGLFFCLSVWALRRRNLA